MFQRRRARLLRGIGAVMLLMPSITLAQSSRHDDLVTLRNDKFISEETSLCEVVRSEMPAARTRFQMGTYAEAPAVGVVSRDYFVAHTAVMLTFIRIALASQMGVPLPQALDAIECKEISSPIGTVDTEVRIVMTTDGVQVETVDNSTGQVSRNTTPWE